MIDGEPPVDPIHRMRHGREHVLLDQVSVQLVNVLTQLLDRAELTLVDPENKNMDLAAVLGKVSRDLIRDEGPGQVGDLQGSAYAIVVGNRDEIHAALHRSLVQFDRIDKRLRGARSAARTTPWVGRNTCCVREDRPSIGGYRA